MHKSLLLLLIIVALVHSSPPAHRLSTSSSSTSPSSVQLNVNSSSTSPPSVSHEIPSGVHSSLFASTRPLYVRRVFGSSGWIMRDDVTSQDIAHLLVPALLSILPASSSSMPLMSLVDLYHRHQGHLFPTPAGWSISQVVSSLPGVRLVVHDDGYLVVWQHHLLMEFVGAAPNIGAAPVNSITGAWDGATGLRPGPGRRWSSFSSSPQDVICTGNSSDDESSIELLSASSSSSVSSSLTDHLDGPMTSSFRDDLARRTLHRLDNDYPEGEQSLWASSARAASQGPFIDGASSPSSSNITIWEEDITHLRQRLRARLGVVPSVPARSSPVSPVARPHRQLHPVILANRLHFHTEVVSPLEDRPPTYEEAISRDEPLDLSSAYRTAAIALFTLANHHSSR